MCQKVKCASLRLVKPIREKFKSLKGLFIIESAISLSNYSPLLPLTKEGLILRLAGRRQPGGYFNAWPSIYTWDDRKQTHKVAETVLRIAIPTHAQTTQQRSFLLLQPHFQVLSPTSLAP